MEARPSLHRYGDDYHGSLGNEQERIRRALGPDPLPDARYRLPPLALAPRTAVPDAPAETHEYIIDLSGPVDAERLLQAFSPEGRGAMGYPRLWGRTGAGGRWRSLDDDAGVPGGRLSAAALTWELAALLAEGSEAARELALFTEVALRIAGTIGVSGAPRESPARAAERAAHLVALRARFGRSIELRLLAVGRPFPARSLWRSAIALGMEWGNLDLFHWPDPVSGQPLFTLSAIGRPGYFLPERAAEGEGIGGIALGFELPHSPAPVPVFDRMALALAYFREQLGGRTITREGVELDGERLALIRDDLLDLVEEMEEAGMPAGSPEAERFF